VNAFRGAITDGELGVLPAILTVLGFTRAALLDASNPTELTFVVPAHELDRIGGLAAPDAVRELFPRGKVDFIAEKPDYSVTPIPFD